MEGKDAISDIVVVGEPDFEGQIFAAEKEHNVSFFKQFHLPMIQMAGIVPDSATILELGSGIGQLSYGTLQTITPIGYVATDVFPSLVEKLEINLRKWSTGKHTIVAAALCDPQNELFIKEGAFNVIQSHSVLHHVLDYRAAIKSLYQKLATPGVLIFTEPCLESYMFLCLTLKLFRRSVKLPDDVLLQIDLLTQYVEQRSGALREDMAFLSTFGTGDKYLFSAYDLFALSLQTGGKLYIQRDTRNPKENLKFELEIRGADRETLTEFDRFLSDLLPVGLENSYFCDLRQVFCLIKL
ncbi:class I SAM-dependent methyltransferase [Mesorhizobium sp. M7D.F.Ca.US.004.01.2.1]|uniref:class I SAM-dependent methyltransferase n=3 Tax=unclassified Mesorhizobium TaxID=325217 RepID=UPI0019D0C9A2|nr:class I SAM-dependent methyltransferase [Mesorhizobium sp. M7D.F.Ca.US.004.01.2.1]